MKLSVEPAGPEAVKSIDSTVASGLAQTSTVSLPVAASRDAARRSKSLEGEGDTASWSTACTETSSSRVWFFQW